MRHLVAGRKLGRTTSHRWALFRNQMASLVEHERIRTTLPKAKELRRLADRLITIGKKDTLAARRRAFTLVRKRELVAKLFGDLAGRFKDRAGGYTRIYKMGFRFGDAAPMAMIEYLPAEGQGLKTAAEPSSRSKKAGKDAKKDSKKDSKKDAKKASKRAVFGSSKKK